MPSSTNSPPTKRRLPLRPLLAAAAAALLTACSTVSAPPLDPEALIPKALTSCADAPAVPPRPAPGQPRSDEDKANYTADLMGAYLDCKSTVAATATRRAALDAQASPKAAQEPKLAKPPLITIPNPFAKPVAAPKPTA